MKTIFALLFVAVFSASCGGSSSDSGGGSIYGGGGEADPETGREPETERDGAPTAYPFPGPIPPAWNVTIDNITINGSATSEVREFPINISKGNISLQDPADAFYYCLFDEHDSLRIEHNGRFIHDKNGVMCVIDGDDTCVGDDTPRTMRLIGRFNRFEYAVGAFIEIYSCDSHGTVTVEGKFYAEPR